MVRVTPEDAAAPPSQAIAAAAPSSAASLGATGSGSSAIPEVQRVLDGVRVHVRSALMIGLTVEQCFRYFADGLSEIPAAIMRSKLAELDVYVDIDHIWRLFKEFGGDASALDRRGFELMAGVSKRLRMRTVVSSSDADPAYMRLHSAKSIRRDLLPAAISRSNSEGGGRTSSRWDERSTTIEQQTHHFSAKLPVYPLAEGQRLVHDDPINVERFVPIQVGELCERLLYEARLDRDFTNLFDELAALLRKQVCARLHTASNEAFRLYAHHDPDDDQRRIMAVASPTIATKQAGQAAVVHTLNLRLFEAIFRQFADSANFSAIPDEEMQDSHDMTTGLKLDWDGHGGAVEMEAYERGRRLIDSRVKRGCKNLGGYLVGGAWRYLPLWRVCTRHTRPYLEDRWRPGLIPWYAAGGPNTWFFFADSTRAEHRSCCGWCRPLIKRERVFSRLLVKFRVDRPSLLRKESRRKIYEIASQQLAKVGATSAVSHDESTSAGDQKKQKKESCDEAVRQLVPADDVEAARPATDVTSTPESAQAHVGGDDVHHMAESGPTAVKPSQASKAETFSTHFVFMKLFKDYPVDDIEMSKPFVRAQVGNTDLLIITSFAVVGLCSLGYEGYQNLSQLGDNEDPEWTTLGYMALAMVGYFIKAGLSYMNKLTYFREKLISTLFFRAIDNNRGALAAMLYEAEQQEQREALLLFFFLHFHWGGFDDNQFYKRDPGAALTRAMVDAAIEEWLTAVTSINVDFDLDNAVKDLVRLGIVVPLTDANEAAEALDIARRGEAVVASASRSGSAPPAPDDAELRRINTVHGRASLKRSFTPKQGRLRRTPSCSQGTSYCAAGKDHGHPVNLMHVLEQAGQLLMAREVAEEALVDRKKARHAPGLSEVRVLPGEAIEVPGLFEYDPASRRFRYFLSDEGVPYGAVEKQRLQATTEFVIAEGGREAACQRLDDVKMSSTTVRRSGISFLCALRVSWRLGSSILAGPDEREVLIFGLSSYDPGGRTGDTHASEAVGGSCQTVLTAIVISEIFALLLGASESQVQSIHDCTVPLIDALHGRRTAAEWLLRQTKEALLFPGGSGLPLARVTSYPRHLLGKDGEWRARFAPPQQADPTDEHAHTRQYLESFLSAARNLEDEHCYDEPDPALPEQFFAKLRKKGESEVLRAVPIDVAIPHLRARLGEGDITWRKGDLVRVTKPGSNVGKLAVIRDPNWSGRIKVQLYEYGAADDAGDGAGAGQGSPRGVFKSYLSHEIERADAAEMRG